jgi:hypothetical protein
MAGLHCLQQAGDVGTGQRQVVSIVASAHEMQRLCNDLHGAETLHRLKAS